ncbi:MAG: ABC transporter ATP-binding protein/permease [Coriobacteriales bacterium]|jgi:ATP-binding cassette subfamily B protein|nr:ABC transporter ATP-binding protein/permease [Coriobacteriales bacterium]
MTSEQQKSVNTSNNERNGERSNERSDGRNSERSNERSGGRNSERNDERTNERTNERAETKGDGLIALIRYAGNHQWQIVLGCILSGISAVLALVPFLCIWQIACELLSVFPDFSAAIDVALYAWVAAASAAASVIAYMASLGCAHRAAFHVATKIRSVCCNHLLHVPLGYYQSVSSGELRRRIDSGADLTEDVIAHKLPDVVTAIVTPVGFIALSFVFDWRLGLACLIPILLGFVLLSMTMGKGAATSMDDYQDALDAMNGEAVEYVRGIPVVKMFQQTVYSFKRFHHTIVAYGNLAFGFAQSGLKPQLYFALATASTFVILIPVAAFAATAVSSDAWAVFAADVVFYAALCGITSSMLTRVMYIGQSVMSARTAMRNVNAVLAIKPLSQLEVPKQMRNASIVFEDVCFTYPDASYEAIAHVSFSVQPGMRVALVGPSGGGKSTCASLIPRFWDVDSGAVKVGGCDVRDLDPRDLMENVAFVFQGGKLFRDSILENVRASRPDATREEVMLALAEAHCDDIIAKLPQGIDTVIGASGVYLSGGEHQRILLARAILKDAAIVVLDEATAFADADNEARIQESLKRIMSGRTVVTIAHRLTTVVDADQILVLANGAIVERGTHEELINAAGTYKRMWDDYCNSLTWEVTGFDAGEDLSAQAQGGSATNFHQHRETRTGGAAIAQAQGGYE